MTQRMNEHRWEILQEQFGFTDWPAPEREVELRDTQRLAEPGAELDGWQSLRSGKVNIPGAMFANRSFWQALERPPVQLSLDLLETGGSANARELLLDLLGAFQIGGLTRDGRRGDVGFIVQGELAAIFARFNVVALIRNAGRETSRVAGFAKSLDTALLAKAPATR
jgi:hypothetical protein